MEEWMEAMEECMNESRLLIVAYRRILATSSLFVPIRCERCRRRSAEWNRDRLRVTLSHLHVGSAITADGERARVRWYDILESFNERNALSCQLRKTALCKCWSYIQKSTSQSLVVLFDMTNAAFW